MFKCEDCGKSIGPRVAPKMVVTERRERDYSTTIKKEDDYRGREVKQRIVSKGWEIVKELKCCSDCAEAHYERETTVCDPPRKLVVA